MTRRQNSTRDRAASISALRIIVADPEEVSLAGLELFLKSEPDLQTVGEARTGPETLRLVAETTPDLVVSELAMPGLSGIQITHSLHHRMRDESPKIVLLARDATNEQLLAALNAGVSALLVKAAARTELVCAIRAAAEGEATLSPRFTTQLLCNFVLVPTADEAEPPAELASLSARELAVLTGIANGASNLEIARELSLARATVKAHASSIFEKLGVRDRLQAALIAYRSGLVEPTLSGSPVASVRARIDHAATGSLDGAVAAVAG